MSDFKLRVDGFLRDEGVSDSLDDILMEAMSLNSEDALSQVIRIAKDDYGGNTYKWELKSTASAVTLHWGERGLLELAKSVRQVDGFATIKTIIGFLSYVAAGDLGKMPHVFDTTDQLKNWRRPTKPFQMKV